MGLNDPRALGRELDTKEAPDPYDNTKAERFMTTLKVEAIYLATDETFEDIADAMPDTSYSMKPLVQAIVRLFAADPRNS